MVLLSEAHDAAVPELVPIFDQIGVTPLVAFEPEALLTAPKNSVVILVEPGHHAEWLNLHRPVVHRRKLTLLLWCTQKCVDALKTRAVDFFDWISHRIRVPACTPAYVDEAIDLCLRGKHVLALFNAPPARAGWQAIEATDNYDDLRDACQQGPVWLEDIWSATDWLKACMAHAQAGRQYGVVLANPKVRGPEQPWVDCQPVPWKQARELLARENFPNTGWRAAENSLNPHALHSERGPEPLELDTRQKFLLEAAGKTLNETAIRAALDLALLDVAEVWLGEVAPTATVKALELQLQAEQALTQGDANKAVEILHEVDTLKGVRQREVTESRFLLGSILGQQGEHEAALAIFESLLPVFEQMGDSLAWADTKGEIASIYHARGEFEEALRILQEEGLPMYEQLGELHRCALTRGEIADIHHARGQLDEALRIRWDEELPVYEKFGDFRSREQTLQDIADILENRGELDAALRIQRPVRADNPRALRSHAETLGEIADLLRARGKPDLALQIRMEELPAYEHELRSHAGTLGEIANILSSTSELDLALQILRKKVLPASEQLGDLRFRALTLGKIADVLAMKGEFDEALNIRQNDELPIYKRLESVSEQAKTLRKVASLYQARGQLNEALEILQEQVLPAYTALGDLFSQAFTLEHIANIYEALGQFDEELHIRRDELLPLYSRLGDFRRRARAQSQVASILVTRGQLDEALLLIQEEQPAAFEQILDSRFRLLVKTRLAQMLNRRGHADDAQKARSLLAEALTAAQQAGFSKEAKVIESTLSLIK